MTERSPRASLNKTLTELRESILQMGALLDRALEQAVEALGKGDAKLAQRVIEGDEQINDLRFRIEETSLAVIARQQPAAGDLRMVVAALNIVLDLERIGDYAAGIAKALLRLGAERGPVDIPSGLKEMSEASRAMLRQVMTAYGEMDAASARQIAAQDEEMDERYQTLFEVLLDRMAEESEDSELALYLLFAGHNLERVADRVTNIAERVVFMQSGEMEDLNVETTEPEGV